MCTAAGERPGGSCVSAGTLRNCGCSRQRLFATMQPRASRKCIHRRSDAKSSALRIPAGNRANGLEAGPTGTTGRQRTTISVTKKALACGANAANSSTPRIDVPGQTPIASCSTYRVRHVERCNRHPVDVRARPRAVSGLQRLRQRVAFDIGGVRPAVQPPEGELEVVAERLHVEGEEILVDGDAHLQSMAAETEWEPPGEAKRSTQPGREAA